MSTFQLMSEMDHEQVVFCQDKATGLKAIIAIHDTTLGPALGGCRMWDYDSEQDALEDVLRLSRGMTYKAAITGLPLGGGKSVIIGDPKKVKSEALFKSFGRFVQSLGGRYITAEDVNVRVQDMETVALETNYVTGVQSIHGGSGDPSPVTALGVFSGIKAAVKHRLQKNNLKGVRVAIQGCGAVGRYLTQYLTEAGAKVWCFDIDDVKVSALAKNFGAVAVSAEEIFSLDVDVFSPCALGGVINDETIGQLKAPIIAGAANNQLKDEARHGGLLMEKGILYTPDYVINAGGLINVLHELRGYHEIAAKREAEGIYDTCLEIFQEAESQDIPTHVASDRLAERRIDAARTVRTLSRSYESALWIRRRK